MNAVTDMRFWGRLSGRSWILFGLRLIVGGVFIFAATGKIAFPYAFADSIGAFELLHESVLLTVAVFLMWQEGLCGIFLVFGLWTRATALVASTWLTVFFVVLVTAYARGLDIDCGCFGILLESKVGWSSVSRTLALLVFSLLLLRFGPGPLCIDDVLSKRGNTVQ